MNDKENLVLQKSKEFAVRIVNLSKYLAESKKEFILSKQILRCGTSIGANLTEAEYGFSKRDFLSKNSISLKECAETKYWLDLLHDTEYISDSQYFSLNDDCTEILKILIATVKTMRNNLETENN